MAFPLKKKLPSLGYFIQVTENGLLHIRIYDDTRVFQFQVLVLESDVLFHRCFLCYRWEILCSYIHRDLCKEKNLLAC